MGASSDRINTVLKADLWRRLQHIRSTSRRHGSRRRISPLCRGLPSDRLSASPTRSSCQLNGCFERPHKYGAQSRSMEALAAYSTHLPLVRQSPTAFSSLPQAPLPLDCLSFPFADGVALLVWNGCSEQPKLVGADTNGGAQTKHCLWTHPACQSLFDNETFTSHTAWTWKAFFHSTSCSVSVWV